MSFWMIVSIVAGLVYPYNVYSETKNIKKILVPTAILAGIYLAIYFIWGQGTVVPVFIIAGLGFLITPWLANLVKLPNPKSWAPLGGIVLGVVALAIILVFKVVSMFLWLILLGGFFALLYFVVLPLFNNKKK